jgi:hypothetical protein
MCALSGAGGVLEEFGKEGAMHRSIRFPADEGHRTIPHLRVRGSVWRTLI